MTPSSRKRLLAVLLVLLLLPFAAWWFADSWLESSGGRAVLERALAGRIGMPVKLEGDFDLMLFPSIGVSGTRLLIGEPVSGREFAVSREYEASVALRPLIDGRVLIEWIRLTGGVLYPERYPSVTGESVEPDHEPGPVPEIKEIVVRDFQVALPGGSENHLTVSELTVSEFSEKQSVPFSLDIRDLVSIRGYFLLDAARKLLSFSELELVSGEQRVRGHGCLSWKGAQSLQLDLAAGNLDLDSLLEKVPETGEGGGDSPPRDIRVRLTADELTSSGVVARGVVVSLGEKPDCEVL